MTRSGGRVLGIDLGDVRVGLAVSDALRITAQPLESMRTVGPRKDLDFLARLVEERGVREVVVGLPLLMSGEDGPRAVEAREFARKLSERLGDVTVRLWDERLTTVEAERTMIAGAVRRKKRREKVDALAAVLILQGYLDSNSSGGR